MLPGGIIVSLVQTYHTIVRHWRCKLHDWKEDKFETMKNGVWYSTQTCKKCGKSQLIKGPV